MATGTRLMQEISDQFLNCKICFENFRDPKTLSCLHTFCCSCLQNQYEQEANSRSSRYTISIYNRQVTCPLCRKKTDLPTGGVKRLPENFLVSNLTEVLAKRTVSKVPPCEICSTVRGRNIDACSKCLDCSKILCKACVDLHLSTKVTQQHSLIDLEGEKDIQCKAHADECVRFYCEPCDACICVVCAFQEHKDHEVCSFSDGSAKYRTSLESLVGKCKERLIDVGSRLNSIEKYETCVKDVKDRIRDLAISYISQVRAKEKEMMKRIEDAYGGEIKEFVDQKQILQENMDELQSACNLTDIMLKDKSVELLLIKKDIESKMTQLLQPVLPDLPADPKYDVRFVPGDVILGRLSFGNVDDINDKEEIMLAKKARLENTDVNGECLTQTNDPDVITDTALTEKSRTKEMSTSMLSDMRGGVAHMNSQTETKPLISRDTSTNLVETRERGVFAKAYDVKARGTMTEPSDVKSLKCQTESMISSDPSDDVQRHLADQSSQGESTHTSCRQWNTSSTSETPASISTYRHSGRREAANLATSAESTQRTSNHLHQSSSIGDCRPAPDLLPTSAGAYVYSPSRRIRSIKIQTEISALDVDTVAKSSDSDFINSIVQSQIFAEKMRLEKEKASRFSFRDRPRRVRTRDADAATVSNALVAPENTNNETSSEVSQAQSGCIHKACEMTNSDTQTELIEHDDSSTWTSNQSLVVKATSTQSVILDDKETCTPTTQYESKITWTDILSTSERATSTVEIKSQNRSTGTIPIKTGDIGVQIKPYAHTIATNTAHSSFADQDSQTTVETIEQGTMPDIDILMLHERKENELAKERDVLESSVDFVTPPQSPEKPAVRTVDKATDPIKTQLFTKATETIQIKMVTSSTETPITKCVDKDTATSEIKFIDQWTETPVPQLISTGVTPPIPATIEVGVATNVVLTDEQATSTDVKAYRDSHTETVVVLCDNETLTEVTKYSDAQTGVDIYTDNQECETDKMDNADEGCMTDHCNPWEAVKADTQSTQCDSLPRDSRASRRRKRAQEVQTIFPPTTCGVCGHINNENGQCSVAVESSNSAALEAKVAEEQRGMLGKEFKDSCTMPRPWDTQDVGTMAISCVTCLHDFQEMAIQTSQPVLYDKSSATSFETDLDFLERTLSRDYHDAATSTESLPYIGLLSEIDVDELIVVPEAAFELVSDTESDFDLIMVDDETSTDFLQSVEVGTQTFVPTDEGAGPMDSSTTSMTESTNGKCVGERIKCLVQSHGAKADDMSEGFHSKHVVSIGINTIPKLTFEKETCTPIRHLFSKGTMTFFVSKMDKSTSTLSQARIITGSSLTKTTSADKITMTARAEKKDIGVETEAAAMDGRITKCITKLRSVSEKLNSPPAKKAAESDSFFGTNFSPSKVGSGTNERLNSTNFACALEKPEEERQRQLKTLLEQTNALLKSKDRSPVRKPQPITTLKGRIPASIENNASTTYQTLKPESRYDSKSLPRGFPSDRPGTVRMGSQPLSPSRLPLLRYNSAPGRIATVPTQMLLKKPSQVTPVVSPSASPRMSPSKIPVSKKSSPPEFQARKPPPLQQQQPQHSIDTVTQEPLPAISPLRRPLPSITETRTPSSCSDSSTASYMSAESNASAGHTPTRLSIESAAPPAVPNKLSIETTSATSSSKQIPEDPTPVLASNRISVDLATMPSRSPSTSTSLSVASTSLTDSVFKKSTSSDVSHSADSSDTLEEKPPPEDKAVPTPPKKSGMGFMQRLLSRKKKAPEVKKEPVPVIKLGPSTAAAVAALASAPPPMPAPPPESYAHVPLQQPPHHYPPLPEHSSPAAPRKPRPFVYVQQRIVSIQQDNVEEMEDRKTKTEDAKSEPAKEEEVSGKDKRKEKEKPPEKQKDKAKKDSQAEKEKKKKEEKEKSKAKATKTKIKKSDDKNNSPLLPKKSSGAEGGDKK
ncbi:hypothetical protein BsWGS_12343 [Bradybaena similaris]